jgi:hypothetical protein
VETIEPGGDDRDRTDDPLLAKQVLSQLSYAPRALTPPGLIRCRPQVPGSGSRQNPDPRELVPSTGPWHLS